MSTRVSENNLLKDTNIYVVHALSGYEYQEKWVAELFKKNNLEFEFVCDGDPSATDKQTLEEYFTKTVLDLKPAGGISCTLNHMLAYKKFIDSNKKYAIVFENDPCFLGNFHKKLNRMFSEMKSLDEGFIISLENTTLTFPSFFQAKKNKTLYRASAGRMAGAYLIDREGAQRAITDLQQHKCDDIIDWWHNHLVDRNILNMYWAHPPLVEQGSHNGIMSSTISTKQSSLSRRLAWLLQKTYKMCFRRLFNQSRIIEDNTR